MFSNHQGESDRMNSAFHLSYNMILNLLRVEGVSPEFMLDRCFYTFQNNANVPRLEEGLYECHICFVSCQQPANFSHNV